MCAQPKSNPYEGKGTEIKKKIFIIVNVIY